MLVTSGSVSACAAVQSKGSKGTGSKARQPSMRLAQALSPADAAVLTGAHADLALGEAVREALGGCEADKAGRENADGSSLSSFFSTLQ